MKFRDLYRRGLTLVLSDFYGLVADDVRECLKLVNWDVDRFKKIADKCIWHLSVKAFRRKL